MKCFGVYEGIRIRHRRGNPGMGSSCGYGGKLPYAKRRIRCMWRLCRTQKTMRGDTMAGVMIAAPGSGSREDDGNLRPADPP